MDTISLNEEEYLTLLTNQNTMKRIKVSDLVLTGRAKRGATLLKKVKSVNYEIVSILKTTAKSEITIIGEDIQGNVKNTEIPIMDINSTGSLVSKKKVLMTLLKVELETPKEIHLESEKEEEPSPTQVSFDLDDFKL